MTKRRMFSWCFILIGLVVMSAGIAAARSWPGPNPYDLMPGIREIGLYQMRVPGTYGYLLPIRPFPYTKDDKGTVSSMSAPGGSAQGPAVMTIGGNVSGAQRGGIVTSLDPKMLGYLSPGGGFLTGAGGGGNLSPTGEGVSRAENLESHLRDTIRKLNSK